MEQVIIASKTIKAIGQSDFFFKIKEAMKEGYVAEDNPEVIGNMITQVMVKYQYQEEYQ